MMSNCEFRQASLSNQMICFKQVLYFFFFFFFAEVQEEKQLISMDLKKKTEMVYK